MTTTALAFVVVLVALVAIIPWLRWRNKLEPDRTYEEELTRLNDAVNEMASALGAALLPAMIDLEKAVREFGSAWAAMPDSDLTDLFEGDGDE